jgi:hypothetical protein
MKNKDGLPKIVFEQMPLELETEMFFGFLDKDWSFKITDKYPQFLEIKNIKLNKERIKAIESEIIKIRTELGDKMTDGLKFIEEEWNKIQSKVFKVLSEIIQEDWTKKEIVGYVSINPICPRFLDHWSFSVPVDRKHPNLVIVHEISHFLYFKKLKKDFPEVTRDKYESPHKEWILSEIITPIILNDTRILNLIGPGAGFYEKHKELKINGESFIGLVQKLYNEFVIQKKDFSEFIKKSLELLKELK